MSGFDKPKVPSVYGLVLIGGQSSRMKTPKWTLSYHGKTQLQYCCDLLSGVCEKVFVSLRQDQDDHVHVTGVGKIYDPMESIGPVGGIISAMEKYSNVAWLVLACDLPLIDEVAIKLLYSNRDPQKSATVFQSAEGFIEPLCAIYEPTIVDTIRASIRVGNFSPKKLLESVDAKIVVQTQSKLMNVNDPVEKQQALELLNDHVQA